MKFQADFELHMSYHNSVKQIFTFCDTKVYPLKYDNKQAYFMINIDDTFGKVDTYKLDNKMGISEGVNGLYLLDLTLKDRDKFIITFSGIFLLIFRVHLCAKGRTSGERISGKLL